MSNAILLCLSFVLLAGTFALGFILGMNRGADEQWLLDWSEQQQREQEKRDAHGRFKRRDTR